MNQNKEPRVSTSDPRVEERAAEIVKRFRSCTCEGVCGGAAMEGCIQWQVARELAAVDASPARTTHEERMIAADLADADVTEGRRHAAAMAPDREKIAEAIYTARHPSEHWNMAWSEVGEEIRDIYRRLADAAIAAGAGQGLTPEEAKATLVALHFGMPDEEPGRPAWDVLAEARAKLRAIAAQGGGPDEAE